MRTTGPRAYVFFPVLLVAGIASCSLTAPSDNELLGGGSGAGQDASVGGAAGSSDAAPDTTKDQSSGDGQGSEPLSCGVTEKVCNNACVSKNDPAYGCTEQGCTACSLQHVQATCLNGQCQLGACEQGWGDCDQDQKNGCEVNLQADPGHCGACATSCSFANASAACDAGKCALGDCLQAWDNCDNDTTNGCETQVNDINHCGGCSTVCAPANANPACNNGTCEIASCKGNYQDCDHSAANGCEAIVSSDPLNCGACGTVCKYDHASAACTWGNCQMQQCDQGYSNCNSTNTDGCEADTSSDPENCGGCNNPCNSNAHMTPTCANSQCGAVCETGWTDCDGTQATGCEANLQQDAQNCGTCGHACPGTTHADGACAGGSCTYQCQLLYGDCDNNMTNGCEALLAYDEYNCGQCGRTCPNGGNCQNGACPPETLAQNVNAPTCLALSDTTVYFCASLQTMIVPKTGGNAQTLESLTFSGGASGVALDANWSYWTSYNNGVITRDTLTPGTADTNLITNVPSVYAVAVDATHIYFGLANGTTGSVQRALKDGTGVQILAANQQEPRGIALDASYVYWVNRAIGHVERADKTTLGLTTLVTGQSNPNRIAVDATSMYWTNRGSGTVMKANLDGSSVTTLAANSNNAYGIAVDGTHVYWTTDTNPGVVMKVPKAGGTPVPLATNIGRPTDIVVDSTHAYFTANVADAVMRVPK